MPASAHLLHQPRFRPLVITSLALIVTLSGSGCATLINLAINPQGVANQALDDTVHSIADVDVNDLTNSANGDIDRILREHPDAVNRAQLSQLKNDMQGSDMAMARRQPRDDLQRERAAEHDRRMQVTWRKRTDSLVVAPLSQYYEVPYGIRTTPLSHYPQDGLGFPEHSAAILETDPIRFSGQ